MSRFSSRALSLVLATIFLFSAAGISFAMLFRGTQVFAAADYHIVSPSFVEYRSDGTPADSGEKFAVLGKKYQLTVRISDKRLDLKSIAEIDESGNIKFDEKNKYAIIKKDFIPKFSATFADTVFAHIDLPQGYVGYDKENANAVIFKNFAEYKEANDPTATATTYDIVFPCVEYRGGGNMIKLMIEYPKDLNIPNSEFQIQGAREQASTPPSDNSYRPSRGDDDSSSSSRADIAPPTPNIIVSEYSYGGGTVTAAGSFSLKVKFTNTSTKLPIDNIVMKVGVPEAFTISSSSNTFYVDKLSRNSSVERTINLSVKPNAEPISHPIKLSFSFEAVIDQARKQFTSEQEISIPVAQLDRFSLNPVEVPPELIVGEDMGVEATFINKGKTTVYNVSAEITGNIAQPGQRQFIGNLEGGKEDSADFMINALEAGQITGEIIITYEDANMNVNQLRSPFTANATAFEPAPMDMEAVNNEEMPAEPLPWYQAIPIWAWMVGGVVLIIFAAFTVKIIRTRREKKLEEQDEDF